MYKTLMYLLAGSELYDFIWLWIYAGPWLSGEERDEGIEDGVRRFVCLLSIICFLFKIYFIFLLYHNLKEISKP